HTGRPGAGPVCIDTGRRRRRRSSMSYLVVVVVVVDSDVLDDAGGDGGVVGAGDADGLVVDDEESVRVDELVVVSRDGAPGDADGAGGTTRSRSVTRSLRSVQPARSPAPSTRAHTPVSNFCIVVPPRWIRTIPSGLQRGCRRAIGLRYARPESVHRTMKESSQ